MSSALPPPPAGPSASVLGAVARDAAELAASIRREFERALLERYGQPPVQDPTLATLFHANAVQLARVYAEAEQVFPEAVLDDLVAGLGMAGRAATPAQTVVGFTTGAGAELVTSDHALAGVTPQGEQLAFAVDVPVRVGPARLVFAAVAEGGRLHVLPGATIPTDGRPGAALPLPSAVAPLASGDAGRAPALVLAFDGADAAHLSGLGLFVDVQGADHPVARALARAAWHLVPAGDGPPDAALGLRPTPGPGGVWCLEWQVPPDPRDTSADPATLAAGPRAGTPPGAYGPLCWRWPEVPAERRVRAARPPRYVAAVLDQVVPLDFAARYARPLVWVEAVLPPGARGVAAAVQRVVAHAAPASNVEPFHERVDVGALGAVVAFRPEGARGRHLMRVLGVTGEHGSRYADEADPAAGPARGRYRVRGGELELRPATGPRGERDRYVLARLLYTDAARANGLQPGDVTSRAARPDAPAAAEPGLSAAGLVVARGGSAPPRYAPARTRFAEELRRRERVVTPADVDAAARAFDPRVLGAGAREDVQPGRAGVPPTAVVRVTAAVRRADFGGDPAALAAFAAALERHLQARAPLGTALRAGVVALERDRRRTPRGTAWIG